MAGAIIYFLLFHPGTGMAEISNMYSVSIHLDKNTVTAASGEIGLTILAKDQNGKGISGLAPVVTLDPRSTGTVTRPLDLGDGMYICSLNGLTKAGRFFMAVSIDAKKIIVYFNVTSGGKASHLAHEVFRCRRRTV